jgi:hypothetical protein
MKRMVGFNRTRMEVAHVARMCQLLFHMTIVGQKTTITYHSACLTLAILKDH